MTRVVSPPTSADMAHAREVIAKHLPYPVPTVQIDRWTFLHLESLQPPGTFKVRGGLVGVSAADPSLLIVTASAGNHALGVAWAARALQREATIVLPETASAIKVKKLRDLDANLLFYGTKYDDAEAKALERADQGATFVSPYNDTHVIAGQSTVLDAVLAGVPGDEPLTVVVPVGGGGLISGIALRARELDRDIRVVGVEVEASPAVSSSVRAGESVELPIGPTIADGLAGNVEPGSATISILRDSPIDWITVSEDDLRGSIRTLFHTHGVVAEGSAAVAHAALAHLPDDRTRVAIITGRNIAWDVFADIVGS